jgi:DNA invertase Pin-like site-specific DNA recombinase
MSRIFAYCRVSTLDQTTENQKLEIRAAGFVIESHRTAVMQRLEAGASVAEAAREFKTSRQTIMRVRGSVF